jgi:SAM-dependent methyltransferase
MTDWHKHWNRPELGRMEPLLQVGKTTNGTPIRAENIDIIVQDIRKRLHIVSTDSVLDLCCGNGVVTQRCALYCRSVTGIDYSKPLLETAVRHFTSSNISYVLGDVTALPSSILDQRFDKIYMYEALQHLGASLASEMLRQLRGSSLSAAPVLLAGIPDEDRLELFYDTPARREEYLRRKAAGTEAIGHWWSRAELERLASDSGYSIEFFAQNLVLHTAHYRFDALFRPILAQSLP